MENFIELSASEWHTLLGYLDPLSSAFATVKHAIESSEAPMTAPLAKVTLTCSKSDAAAILGIARQFVPEVAPRIEAALAGAREQ